MRLGRYVVIVAMVVLAAVVADRSLRRDSPFAGREPATSIVVEVVKDRPTGGQGRALTGSR